MTPSGAAADLLLRGVAEPKTIDTTWCIATGGWTRATPWHACRAHRDRRGDGTPTSGVILVGHRALGRQVRDALGEVGVAHGEDVLAVKTVEDLRLCPDTEHCPVQELQRAGLLEVVIEHDRAASRALIRTARAARPV